MSETAWYKVDNVAKVFLATGYKNIACQCYAK